MMTIEQSTVLSLVLFAKLQNRRLSITERMTAFSELLELEYGFWQRPQPSSPESLRGFVLRFASALLMSVPPAAGAPSAEQLAEGVLLAFFDSAPRIDVAPRKWLMRAIIRLMKPRRIDAGAPRATRRARRSVVSLRPAFDRKPPRRKA